MKRSFALVVAMTALVAATLTHVRAAQKPALSDADITDLATILKLEDTRTFDQAELSRLLASKHPEVKRRAVIAVGRIVNPGGSALLEPLRKDPSAEIVADVAFASGQLKDASAVEWLGQVLNTPKTPSQVSVEAARALGKIRTPEAWSALAAYLTKASGSSVTSAIIGEALLSIGRFPSREDPANPRTGWSIDITPIMKWTTSQDVEIRWRATWALYRPRNPAAANALLKLSQDPSPEVRFWAARGLTPIAQPTAADAPKVENLDPAVASARLRALLKDADRRVRTESLRALTAFNDDASFAALAAALDDPDTWMSVSAAETTGRMTNHADVLVPKLTAIVADEKKPSALRTVAKQQLSRLTAPPPDPNAAPPAGRAGGGQQGRGGRGGNQATPAAIPARTDAEYRAIVERWIVPAYNGA
jgi:HEAT repeat protein